VRENLYLHFLLFIIFIFIFIFIFYYFVFSYQTDGNLCGFYGWQPWGPWTPGFWCTNGIAYSAPVFGGFVTFLDNTGQLCTTDGILLSLSTSSPLPVLISLNKDWMLVFNTLHPQLSGAVEDPMVEGKSMIISLCFRLTEICAHTRDYMVCMQSTKKIRNARIENRGVNILLGDYSNVVWCSMALPVTQFSLILASDPQIPWYETDPQYGMPFISFLFLSYFFLFLFLLLLLLHFLLLFFYFFFFFFYFKKH
jgi:hypothetical protein